MSIKIFYFSGTGNSLYAAKMLASKLGDAEVIPIANINEDIDISSCDKIGIVFPVYAWGPPRIVTKFAETIDLKDKYVFSAATYGGFIGGTLLILDKILKNNGAKIAAGFGLKQPGNYVVGYGSRLSPEEAYKKVSEKTEKKLDEIAEAVKNSKETGMEANAGWINAVTNIAYSAFITHFKEQEKGFWVNGNCNDCKVCERICPVENIKVIDGKRVWQGKCEMCMACIQWCPKEAIQHGKGTAKRRRYQHPKIKIEEMLKR